MGSIGLCAGMARWGVLGTSLAIAACNGHGDDGDDTTTLTAEEQQCETAEIELTKSCFFPRGGEVEDDPDRPTVTDIAASADALNGGFYLPRIDASDATDQVGFVLEDNDACRVSCLTQCDITLHSLCVTTLTPAEDGVPRGCLFCGEATREECQSFIDACE